MTIYNIYNTGYECLIVALSCAFITQVFKCLLHLLIKRKFDLRMFTTTGGMPSSHSSGVISLATSVGLISGFSSTTFAVALGYALVVMYDAAGVRRAAGKQAACLNRIIMDVYKQDLQEAGGKLKELLGHTPMQVFVGAIVGIFYAYYAHIYLGSKIIG